MTPPELVTKYGTRVWSDTEMDELRKNHCLCLRCGILFICPIATQLYAICKDRNLALMTTRCQHWRQKEEV